MVPKYNHKSLTGSLRIRLHKALGRANLEESEPKEELSPEIELDSHAVKTAPEPKVPEPSLWQRVKKTVGYGDQSSKL